jgi:hypothetical protein
LGLAAGCYAGIEDESEDFDRTRGACVYTGSNGESSTYAWNCDSDGGDSKSAVVRLDGRLAIAPADLQGPIEDAILQNAGDMVGGIIADCLEDPEFAMSCTNSCAEMGLSWNPDPGVCTEEMDFEIQIVGDLDDDPGGGVCPDGSPRMGGLVVATAACQCQCGAPIGGGQPPPPPPPPPPPG